MLYKGMETNRRVSVDLTTAFRESSDRVLAELRSHPEHGRPGQQRRAARARWAMDDSRRSYG
jgi:hypothetical protein